MLIPPSRRLRVVLVAAVLAVGGAWFGVAPTADATTQEAMGDAVINLLNKDREAMGRAPLRRHAEVTVVALERAKKVAAAGVIKHSIAGDLGAQLTARGVAWQSYGEALGWSSDTWGLPAAEHIYRLWNGSPTHWNLLTSSGYDSIGVGFALGPDGNTYASAVVIDEVEAASPSPSPSASPAPTASPSPSASPSAPVAGPTGTPSSTDQAAAEDEPRLGGLHRLGARLHEWTAAAHQLVLARRSVQLPLR